LAKIVGIHRGDGDGDSAGVGSAAVGHLVGSDLMAAFVRRVSLAMSEAMLIPFPANRIRHKAQTVAPPCQDDAGDLQHQHSEPDGTF